MWAVLVLAANVFATKADPIVVVVWDGLRLDSVNESNTAALFQLARHSVFLQNHHAEVRHDWPQAAGPLRLVIRKLFTTNPQA